MDSVPSDGDCLMDELPDEIFAKILNLLPIKHVLLCFTVSRRWDAACRYIVRTRESLIIGSDDWYRKNVFGPNAIGGPDVLQKNYYHPKRHTWGLHPERPSQRLDGITLADGSLVSEMMKSLNQIVELKRLCVETSTDPPSESSYLTVFEGPASISTFIRKFAEQLTMLEIDFAVSMIGADAFPHLTRLRCRLLGAR